MEILLILVLLGVVLVLVLQWRGAAQSRDGLAPALMPLVQQNGERLERELRDELNRSAAATRQELLAGLAQFQQTLLNQGSTAARSQGEHIEAFRLQLTQLQQMLAAQSLAAREAQDAAALRSTQAQTEASQRLSDALREQMLALQTSNEQRLAEVRHSVEQRLGAIQQDNEKKLEQMRATVDEKLHATLEQRLGESFKQVAERLEQVHKGLGEMQNLARDVGSLNRVLTNVKTRGIFGEVQLAG
ncbi:MAG: DNA recombination protein RmuC, partial [Paucibacter sp.]|nr:DNA recombination protein RmuC [Roseateles sp.]